MGVLHVFGTPEDVRLDAPFDLAREYLHQDELTAGVSLKPSATSTSSFSSDTSHTTDATVPSGSHPPYQYALIEFEKPVTCPANSLVIGSKLDTDVSTCNCVASQHSVPFRH